MKPHPGASASPVADRVSSSGPCCRAQESQSWHWPAGGQGQGPGNAGCRVALVLGLGSLGDKTCPRASTSPLLGRAGSWDLRLQSSGSWSLNWSAGGQGQCPGCPQAHVSSLGYGEGVKLGLWLQVLGVPVLVPLSWYVGLSLGPLVGRPMSQGVCGLRESQGS